MIHIKSPLQRPSCSRVACTRPLRFRLRPCPYHNDAFKALSSRRETLLSSFLMPPFLGVVIGTDDSTTIVNSVLSAYGLPTLKASSGYKFYDDFQSEFTFEYPSSWVTRANTLRSGIYISDFKTADKITVEVFPVPADGDILHAAVAKAISPVRQQQDDRLELPNDRLIKSSSLTLDGQEYLYLRFPSETITRSGYQVVRRNYAVAAVKGGTVYTLNASSTTDQYSKSKEEVLSHVTESFRLR